MGLLCQGSGIPRSALVVSVRASGMQTTTDPIITTDQGPGAIEDDRRRHGKDGKSGMMGMLSSFQMTCMLAATSTDRRGGNRRKSRRVAVGDHFSSDDPAEKGSAYSSEDWKGFL